MGGGGGLGVSGRMGDGWRGEGRVGTRAGVRIDSSFGGAAHHTEPYQLRMSSIRKITLKMAVPVVQILGFFLSCGGGAWRVGGWVGECRWPGCCVLTGEGGLAGVVRDCRVGDWPSGRRGAC